MHYSLMLCNVLYIKHNTYNGRIWCVTNAFIIVVKIVLLPRNLRSESWIDTYINTKILVTVVCACEGLCDSVVHNTVCVVVVCANQSVLFWCICGCVNLCIYFAVSAAVLGNCLMFESSKWSHINKSTLVSVSDCYFWKSPKVQNEVVSTSPHLFLFQIVTRKSPDVWKFKMKSYQQIHTHFFFRLSSSGARE